MAADLSPNPPASQPPSYNPDTLSSACPKPQLHSMGGAPCLLTVPWPCLIGQGILTAVVHVLIQVVRVHGARRHLLEVEAGLWNALYQLQRIQPGTIGCLMQRNHQRVESPSTAPNGQEVKQTPGPICSRSFPTPTPLEVDSMRTSSHTTGSQGLCREPRGPSHLKSRSTR